MRAATTIRTGPDQRATRRPPGRLDSHRNWTDRRGLGNAYYVYSARPAERHAYHAIMFDGNGNKIVDGWGSDTD